MLVGLQNFLKFIYENWTSLTIIGALLVSITAKVVNLFKKDKQDKVDAAKTQIKQILLKLVTDAETDYENWDKAGSIKRAQVIQKIYTDYPIFSKVIEQNKLTKWIDTEIDNSLDELREIISNNVFKETDEETE